MDSDTAELCLVQGVEGLALYINNYRVAGPKPWGGGTAVWERRVPVEKIDIALGRQPFPGTEALAAQKETKDG